jgi:hypothetical protein
MLKAQIDGQAHAHVLSAQERTETVLIDDIIGKGAQIQSNKKRTELKKPNFRMIKDIARLFELTWLS